MNSSHRDEDQQVVEFPDIAVEVLLIAWYMDANRGYNN